MGNTAKLVDAATFDENGGGVSTTLPRADFEEALKAGKGPVEILLNVKRIAGNDPAQTVDVSLERRDLKKLLKKTDGDAITLTFAEQELLAAVGDDVEAHGVREQALVLTVAAAAAAAGISGAYLTQHNLSGATSSAPAVQMVSDAASGGGYPAQAEQISDAASGGGYTTPAPQLVSDAATGGYATDQGDAVSRYVGNIQTDDSDAVSRYVSNAQTDTGDAVSRYVANQTPEQVSDAASSGGYSAPAQGGSTSASMQPVSDAASGSGYTTNIEQISDAATGGYTTDGGDALSRYVANQTPEQVSDAASGGGYSSAEAPSASVQQVSDAASGSGYTTNIEQVSDAATGGYTTEEGDALSRYVANQTPNQVSDAASGGGYSSAEALSASVQPVSDAASGSGYTAPGTAQASGGGSSFTEPAGVAGAALAGLALLITGASVVTRGARRNPRPA